MENKTDIIDYQNIRDIISNKSYISRVSVSEILSKAKELKGLNLEDAAILLNVSDKEILEEIAYTAKEIKEKICGNLIRIFVPLYLSNNCINNCLYCGFRKENKSAVRGNLSIDQIITEVNFLTGLGYKRILLVLSEQPDDNELEYILNCFRSIRDKNNNIIINLNCAPLDVKGFMEVSDAGIEMYQSFQETYDIETYAKMHPAGKKRDYQWRITTMDRAIAGGIKDIGMGILLGLYDYRFETLALLSHIDYLKNRYGVIPSSISVPRLRNAIGSVIKNTPYLLSDDDLKNLIAIFRLSVPSSDITLSTRENKELRDNLLSSAVSMISAGSKTEIGGYVNSEDHRSSGQFIIEDNRSLKQMIDMIIKKGLVPEV